MQFIRINIKQLILSGYIILYMPMCVIAQNGSTTASLSDGSASRETAALYANLKNLASKGFMFGHQDDLAYGVNWKYEPGRSDVKESCGDYPAVYGWDLCGLETNDATNIDGVPFLKMRQYIIDGYKRGAVVTIDWHFRSPFGKEKGAWDTTAGTVASILPGGINHDLYKKWLDNGAAFIKSLKGPKGESIPILFRPFHELTGNWFWWGPKYCTVKEFTAIWAFTKNYLANIKKIHNLIYVYNTGGDWKTKADFLERYPGDDMVDIVSFDIYQYGDTSKRKNFIANTNSLLKILTDVGKEKNKLIALAETGYEQIPDANWWTKTLIPIIGSYPVSYVLIWRNHGLQAGSNPPHMHYYAPYKGHLSEKDFRKFYSLGNTFFENDIAKEHLYRMNPKITNTRL